MPVEDPFNLERFVSAQRGVYETALKEVRSGSKQTHWMWFIFPQRKGLGHSNMSAFYGIASDEEAKAYLNHPILGKRLREITHAVSGLKNAKPETIFGFPDSLKFASCMQLFASVDTEKVGVFTSVLNQFYKG